MKTELPYLPDNRGTGRLCPEHPQLPSPMSAPPFSRLR